MLGVIEKKKFLCVSYYRGMTWSLMMPYKLWKKYYSLNYDKLRENMNKEYFDVELFESEKEFYERIIIELVQRKIPVPEIWKKASNELAQ